MRKLGESEGMYELPTGKKPEARGFQTLEWSTSRDFYSNAGGSAIAYSPKDETQAPGFRHGDKSIRTFKSLKTIVWL